MKRLIALCLTVAAAVAALPTSVADTPAGQGPDGTLQPRAAAETADTPAGQGPDGTRQPRAAGAAAAEPRAAAAADTLTAADVLVHMPARTLDLLTTGMRLDLLDYYRADSIYRVPNALGGFSHLHRPLTDDYVKVQVTPVSTFTVRLLPLRKDKRLIVTSYTAGDSLQAADSELRFYDPDLNELRRDKYIRMASLDDFFDFKDLDRKTRKELLQMVPFLTVEYILSPDGTDMKARLTAGEFLGRETLEKIEPYLRRERVYRWTGSRYELQRVGE